MPCLENWPLPLQIYPPICYFCPNNRPEDACLLVPLKLFSSPLHSKAHPSLTPIFSLPSSMEMNLKGVSLIQL